MTNKRKIGWIGLGKMGLPMSQNLIQAGYPLTVYNRTRTTTRLLADRGAQIADSPKALAREVEVLISMIADDRALEQVSIAAEGAFAAAQAGTIYIDMSTVSPTVSSRVAEAAAKKGIKYLRAPVSGSTALAEAATLTILTSGPRDAHDACVDIFGALGQKLFYVGSGEEARYLKLVLNMMVGLTSGMIAEALTFGQRGGLDWNQMMDIVNSSVVASPLVGYKTQMLRNRDFAPAFTATQMAKDFDLALGAGRALKVPMPITALVRQFWTAMDAQGKGHLDYFALLSLFEELAGPQKGADNH
ncbi:MAG: NAD(P)-dependent oxidoreductase [Desulfobacterales bacterium]|nr:MAG: NAD(P)-dependent oxidoreductase [Desulfobacterales bacterium]